MDILLPDNPLSEITAGHTLDELQGKDIFATHPFDLLQLYGRGIKHGRQSFELGQGSPGRPLAVGAGRAKGEQELYDFTVSERLDPLLEKLVTEPLTMALTLTLPLASVHGLTYP
jgi:hypothetical protein